MHVYNECMNFINNIVHRVVPHYQLMASCQNVFSVVHWLQDISVKWARRLISGTQVSLPDEWDTSEGSINSPMV